MNLKNLEKIIEKEPAFRKKQIQKLIYQDLITSWDEATVLSLKLREDLKKETSLDINAQFFESKDVKKALITLSDGLQIEAVLMRHEDRNTVCVSSQVGCALGCKFCATGKLGLKRNLTAEEILEQVLVFERSEPINNIVFMGMGEPFLNYDNVLQAIKILNNENAFNIGARHISISTVGIIEGIEKLSNENLQVNLAISIHAPNNILRSRIMPISKKYSLENILKAVDKYIEKTNRKVMFEYTLINDVNDSINEARELAKIMRHPLYLVNLIKYNNTKEFKAPSNEKIENFKNYLIKGGIHVTERFRFGGDIHAACGQLCLKK
ncbi:MAG: 23S rRNA (adenine(2503)-C(2))-methyltransferase RlmN [Candidatus Pacebacteria bacterium]|nr:23S rRNA (adenine(2503)-C(2))-methyltransferase RlmN [Candidatus Paceibacterota bacterium]MDD3918953.1 23S rRNA (adenine(2503)-C(2))-methyltransferase RlmN [Candidatus Paceibacterota bacterium]